MTITCIEDDNTKTIEFTASGYFKREEYNDVIDQTQAFIDRHSTIKMIEVVESCDGFDPSVIWPGIKFDFKNIRNISHVAVVSDIGWLSPLAKAAGALLSTKLRTFEISELDDAREWIKAA